MAESPLSPVGMNNVVDLHTSGNAVVLNENSSTASSESIVSGGAVGIDLQCPATPQIHMKWPDLTSSSSDSEGETQRQIDAVVNAMPTEGSRCASPPPNCAICLGRCKNKCFTDSCKHQFCFKCLCEWSKVKPECPLCKQTFKSIIHNVKSSDQYEEYHVQPPTVQIPHRPNDSAYAQLPLPYFVDGVVVNGPNDYQISVANWDGPRAAHRIVRAGRTIFYPSAFAAATGPSSSASSSSNNNTIGAGAVNTQNQYMQRDDMLHWYRQEFSDSIPSTTLSQVWRRYVYERKLYALPVCDITGRFRDSSARFYRDNPAQVHRLMPWINRDIVCLLRNTEHDVSTVCERINESLSLINILSPTFRRRLQPFLRSKTAHFIHELNNFARSPYDMIGYDRAVQYLPQAAEEFAIEFSSSASDDEHVNVIDGNANAERPDAGTATTARARTRTRDATREANTEALRNRNDYRMQPRAVANSSNVHIPLLSFTISTTSEGTEASGVSVAVSGRGAQSTAINLTTHNRDNDVIIDLDETEGETPGTTVGTSTTTAAAAAAITHNIEITSSSSDECEFVLERKPPHLRTPEMVSLNSESDSDVVFIQETTLRNATFNATDDEAGTSQKKATQLRTRDAHKRTAVKNEQELYDVGASTSAGLRSTGRKRRQKSLDAEKRTLRHDHRHKRSRRAKKGSSEKVRRGKRTSSKLSPTYSSPTSSNESDGSTFATDKLIKKKATKSDEQRMTRAIKRTPAPPTTTTTKAKAKKATNRSGNSKRRQNKGEDNATTHRRRMLTSTATTNTAAALVAPAAAVTDTEYTSEEDESLSLTILKKRLAEQKSRRESEASAIVDSLKIEQSDRCTSGDEDQLNEHQSNENRAASNMPRSKSKEITSTSTQQYQQAHTSNLATTTTSTITTTAASTTTPTSQVTKTHNKINASKRKKSRSASQASRASRTSSSSSSSSSLSSSTSSATATASSQSYSSRSSVASAAEGESDSNQSSHLSRAFSSNNSNKYNFNLMIESMLNANATANDANIDESNIDVDDAIPWPAANQNSNNAININAYEACDNAQQQNLSLDNLDAASNSLNELAVVLADFANTDTRLNASYDYNYDMPNSAVSSNDDADIDADGSLSVSVSASGGHSDENNSHS